MIRLRAGAAVALFMIGFVLGPALAHASRYPFLSLEERQARVAEAAHAVSEEEVFFPAPVREELAYRYTHSGGTLEIVNAYPVAAQTRVARDSAFAVSFLPQRFQIGDGALDGRILAVDRRPGTRLARILDELVIQILGLYGLDEPSELWPATITAFLAAQTQDYLAYPESGSLPDPSPGLSPGIWASQTRLMKSLANAPIGSTSKSIQGYRHPVRDFSASLAEGRGVCLDMVLLDSFLLERFGVPHRVVFGAIVSVGNEGQSSGHAWIELPSGEILDPTWKTLARPQAYSGPHPDWVVFGNSIGLQPRFGYPSFPISGLDR